MSTRKSRWSGETAHGNATWGRVAAISAALLIAQWNVAPAADPTSETPPKTVEKKTSLPPAQEVPLLTGDGVKLHATFYPGTKEKESVPVILLHGFNGSSADYKTLAPRLQAEGHAVLVPDLRGHGNSTSQQKDPNRRLDPSRFTLKDFDAMVRQDMEALKSYLMTKNNDGELNIDKLCVVGSELGAIIALNWAIYDWHWPDFTTGKQGKDVKALVLLSMPYSLRGANVSMAMGQTETLKRLSILMLYGSGQSDVEKESNRIYNVFLQTHPLPEESKRKDEQSLFKGAFDTKLQGTKLLGEKSLNVDKHINQFIKLRLVNKAFPWQSRGKGSQ